MKSLRSDALEHAMLLAAHAIAKLDGALSTSVIRHSWHERAVIVGLANCLTLAGLGLTPAEFFRASVGLVELPFLHALDRGRLSAVVEAALPALAPGSPTPLRIIRLASTAGLMIGAPWRDEQRPPPDLAARLASSLATPRADVGTALEELATRLPETLAITWGDRDPHLAWPGWLVAALLPAAIAGSGLTAFALPCLTGVTRALRYPTSDPVQLAATVFTTLANQATTGLATLRRLEACHKAWRYRLDGLTSRSRARTAAALFLVWPAMTRGQIATGLAMTPAGAGKLLTCLVARDIATATRFGQRTFYVAEESVGDFKLAPRQGRSRAAPLVAPSSALLTNFDAAMTAFDLDVDPADRLDRLDHDEAPWAYRDQP